MGKPGQDKECKVRGCVFNVIARGLCNKHYIRKHRKGLRQRSYAKNREKELRVNETWRKRNRARWDFINWRAHIKREYGISADFYMELLKAQKNRCAICNIKPGKEDKKLAVEHCHETMRIRGLVCVPCNTGLGGFKDKIKSLKEAIKYLTKKKHYGIIKARGR